jgi:hypothetical protein
VPRTPYIRVGKALPAVELRRQRARCAEQELAPASPDVAVRYFIAAPEHPNLVKTLFEAGQQARASPALEWLADSARRDGDLVALQTVTFRWIHIGREEEARRLLAEVLDMRRKGRPGAASLALEGTVALVWSLDRNLPAMERALAEFTEPKGRRVWILQALIGPVCETDPGTAVKLAGQLPDADMRLTALEEIASQLASSAAP